MLHLYFVPICGLLSDGTDCYNAAMQIPSFGHFKPEIVYRARPGAYALLLNPEGLLARVHLPHGYFLPGGTLEDDEDLEDALLREIEEEIAYEARILWRLGEANQYLYQATYTTGVCKHSVFFLAETVEALPGQAEHAFDWVKPTELASSLLHESQRWAVETFAPYLKA